ncbi:hypothetical protein LTR66_011958 [Elasticomyces elasticus]|nr:hypothetical protein LTR66_011958 [Elasticomyces elasticus]
MGFAEQAKFMVRDGRMVFAQACDRARSLAQASSKMANHEIETSFSSDTTVLDDQHNPGDLVHAGCFIFSCDIEPAMARIGWRAGTSYHRGSRAIDSDLLLTMDRSHRVRGTHAIFNWLHDSGAFGIRGRHDNNMLSYGPESLSKARGFIVVDVFDQVVTIGHLTYRLIYTVPPHFQENFQRDKARYMTDLLHIEQPIVSASITPSALDIRLGHWTLLRTAGKGIQSIITAARGDSNELVGVKHLVRKDADSASKVEKEIQLYENSKQRISGQHTGGQHVLALWDIIFTGRSREFRRVSGGADDVYILLTPLVRGTFRSHVLDAKADISEETKLKLFAQAAVGVAAIHRAGYVHRDIKPENLGVLSTQKPFAVVLDLGQLIHTPRDT